VSYNASGVKNSTPWLALCVLKTKNIFFYFEKNALVYYNAGDVAAKLEVVGLAPEYFFPLTSMDLKALKNRTPLIVVDS
jgi:hypothetical protein